MRTRSVGQGGQEGRQGRAAHAWATSGLVMLVLLAAAPMLLLGLAGCEEPNTQAAADNERLTIVTTTGMVRDIVAHVVGDRAEVIGLMGEGVDPHLYNPTRDDVAQMLEADVIFYSGLLLEGRMTDTFVKITSQGKPVHAVTDLIDPEYLIEVEGFAGNLDPHVWMDVQAWSQAVDAVARQMAEVDPAHAEHYASNAASYQAQLEQLDAYVRRVIGSIPQPQRVLVTAHDAFNYFGRAYDIEVRGVQGISTESEAGTNDINRLVDFLVERQIPAVFVESSVSDKAVRALVQGAASRGHDVRIGGTLFSDAMGPAGTYEGTYVGMIDHNATTIARALGGDAPAGGMQGKLTATEAHAP